MHLHYIADIHGQLPRSESTLGRYLEPCASEHTTALAKALASGNRRGMSTVGQTTLTGIFHSLRILTFCSWQKRVRDWSFGGTTYLASSSIYGDCETKLLPF